MWCGVVGQARPPVLSRKIDKKVQSSRCQHRSTWGLGRYDGCCHTGALFQLQKSNSQVGFLPIVFLPQPPLVPSTRNGTDGKTTGRFVASFLLQNHCSHYKGVNNTLVDNAPREKISMVAAVVQAECLRRDMGDLGAA